jgi:hypothetical protein
MNRTSRHAGIAASMVVGLGVAGAGCLSRPVDSAAPRLETNFTTPVENKVISKVDILFDIDNSASMGDKQDYLKSAIPDLVSRFVNPNCVDSKGKSVVASTNGACPAGLEAEFPPVHDMHLGIISSSLGSRGGNLCTPTATAQPPFGNVQAHNDDQAHLLFRRLAYAPATASSAAGVTEGVVADTTTQDPFLYWYPSSNTMPPGAGSPVTDAGTLVTDFTDLVGGTGVFGCGIESQLESWYRFLVQPDPYASIVINPPDATHQSSWASWNDVDTVILQQRHDFLRPDSLVAIVVLSDENDSEIDVRSLGGVGYEWMDSSFEPPRGTSACATAPGSPACQSCAQGNHQADPSCAMGNYTAINDWGFDANLRHVHMKQKYGLVPQFPIQRYFNGLTSSTVPDRCGEYGGGTCSQAASSNYVGTNDCQNPLFSGSLPDGSKKDVDALCHAPPGPRTADLVFYAHIGGVPSTLLHFDPNDLSASRLGDADWVKILGKDPLHDDTTGIDPHMIEDYRPRSGVPGPGSSNTADPVNGHDWVTDTSNGMPGFGARTTATGAHVLSVDREYACTFPLVDSTGRAAPRDCTLAANANFCDCPHQAGGLTPQELPPICDQTTTTLQTGAKAYPTIRELSLAKLMGKQGIVSSICPIHAADEMGGADPLYGYRPAVAVIVDRLKKALTTQCLPEPLQVESDGTVQCLILVQLTEQAGKSTCLAPDCSMPGLRVPKSEVLTKFCQSLEDQYARRVADNGGNAQGITDPATVPVCELSQLTTMANPTAFQGGSCASSKTDQGWCYVTGDAAGKCPQAIEFSSGALPSGAVSSLQCIEQSVSVLGQPTGPIDPR